MKMLKSKLCLGMIENLFGNVDVYAAAFPGFDQIGLGTIPALILGTDVIGKKNVVFDFDDNQVYFEK